MRPHCTDSHPQPYTHIALNDALSEMPPDMPARQTLRFSALLGLVFGIGLAVLLLLGTWLSLSIRDTVRATTFATHSEEQTLSTDSLEDVSIPPIFRDDISRYF